MQKSLKISTKSFYQINNGHRLMQTSLKIPTKAFDQTDNSQTHALMKSCKGGSQED